MGESERDMVKTHEEIAEQLYDELQHNKILNYEEYSKRLYELLDLAHPNEERVGDYVGEVENIIHNKWSFGFCDMCGEVIFYDEGGGRKTRERKMFKTLEQAKSWRDIKLKERIVGK